MWLKLGRNGKSLIKDLFTHWSSFSNADEKWSKIDRDLMHPNKVIAPQSFSKVLTKSAFLINFTLQ